MMLLGDEQMGRMGIDDFIRYAKEQFDCEITVKKSDKPDTLSLIHISEPTRH